MLPEFEGPEVTLNLWYVADQDGFVYSLRGRAYLASGPLDEKLVILKTSADVDYLIAADHPIPEEFRLRDSSGQPMDHSHVEILESSTDPLAPFRAVVRELQRGIPTSSDLVIPRNPVVCITPLIVTEQEGLLPNYSGRIRLGARGRFNDRPPAPPSRSPGTSPSPGTIQQSFFPTEFPVQQDGPFLQLVVRFYEELLLRVQNASPEYRGIQLATQALRSLPSATPGLDIQITASHRDGTSSSFTRYTCNLAIDPESLTVAAGLTFYEGPIGHDNEDMFSLDAETTGFRAMYGAVSDWLSVANSVLSGDPAVTVHISSLDLP